MPAVFLKEKLKAQWLAKQFIEETAYYHTWFTNVYNGNALLEDI